MSKDNGVRGLIRFVRESIAGPWLDGEWLREKLTAPFQLRAGYRALGNYSIAPDDSGIRGKTRISPRSAYTKLDSWVVRQHCPAGFLLYSRPDPMLKIFFPSYKGPVR